MAFVLDNSVVSGWYLANQASDYTRFVAKRLQADRVWVPPIWELEFTNVLRTACIRGRLNAEQAQTISTQIGTLPIDIDRVSVLRSEVLALALRFSLSSYDAAYLELALRRQLPLATQDEDLKAAAIASGAGWLSEKSVP